MTETVAARPVPLAGLVRFELVKQFSQWRVRVLLIVCWIAPGRSSPWCGSRTPSAIAPVDLSSAREPIDLTLCERDRADKPIPENKPDLHPKYAL